MDKGADKALFVGIRHWQRNIRSGLHNGIKITEVLHCDYRGFVYKQSWPADIDAWNKRIKFFRDLYCSFQNQSITYMRIIWVRKWCNDYELRCRNTFMILFNSLFQGKSFSFFSFFFFQIYILCMSFLLLP